MTKFKFYEDDTVKMVRSENVNYNFNKITGYTETWGKTKDVEVIYSDIGPHILDIEISTVCDGYKGSGKCSCCYKIGTENPNKNMSLETFKTILDKFSVECYEVETVSGKVFWANYHHDPKEPIKNVTKTTRNSLEQLAAGSGAFGIENPEVFSMMEYARSKGVIPNITVANLSDDSADKFSKLCGAMAISKYADKNVCYDTIKKLTDRGMTQINIHFVLHKHSKNLAIETMKDMMTDPRLEKMNAIVFLSLKKKGNGENLQTLSQEGFEEVINFAFENKIKFGMDSCSGGKFMTAISSREDFDKIMEQVEPCESTKISSYINVDGKFYSCSFCENTESFKEGIDVVNCNDFLEDVWENEATNKWRNNLISKNNAGNFSCPVFEV
jgi:hypothetical protein